MTGLERFQDAFLKPELIARYWPDILSGVALTLQIAVAVVITGLALGLALAVVRSYRSRLANAPIIVFVDMFRALPPLVAILIVYFGLPNLGINISGFAVLWLVLSLVLAAFAEEIFWSGITSVRKGQWEAARSTGLTWVQTYRFVVLPQASRNVLPDLVSNTVEVVKLTSIASVVSFTELLYAADMARSVTYNTSPIVLAAFLYLIVLWPVVRLVSRLEHRIGH